MTSLPADLEAVLEEPEVASPSAAYVISDAHELASKLRVPLFARDENVTRTARVEQLEEYMLLSAYYLGEISRERLTVHRQLAGAEDEWAKLQPPVPGRTVKEDEQKKARFRPDLAAVIRESRWRVARLSEEIDRLDRDATKVSRVYTMMTGGT